MEPNIWIDLTDLFAWRGHFTGIQRVAYSYAIRYSKEGAKFFIYSAYQKRFVEVPFDIIHEVALKRARSLHVNVKGKLKKLYFRLPERMQDITEPAARTLLHWYRKLLAVTFFRGGYDRLLIHMPTAHFYKGDIVVVLGAGWNKDGFIDQVVYRKRQNEFKLVVHLNDILPVYQPQLFAQELPEKFSQYAYTALRYADLILTISKASRNDIERFCSGSGISCRVEIIRLGEDIKTARPLKPRVNKLERRFILSVGTFEIRKNYLLLYQALKLAQSESKAMPQIVIAGRKGWLTEDLEYLINNDPDSRYKLLHLKNMSDENLSWLYKNSMFTVFPSLSEGWGLPIAESLHYGKLCLSSNASSMPEIAGDLVDYFSPYDTRGCAEKILEYSTDEEKLKQKNETIKQKYDNYSWDDSFAQLKKYLNKVKD